MSRDLQQLVSAQDATRLLAVYDTALDVFVNSFRAPPSSEIEELRVLILKKHPNVARDAILSGQHGVMTWLHDRKLFLTQQSDMSVLYEVIRVHNAAANIFMEASSLFNQFVPDDPHEEAYVKCKFSLGPKFDPDFRGSARDLLRKCWAADDDWMVVRLAEYHYGMNADSFVPALPQDVVDLIDTAAEMLPRAPRTTAAMAPRFSVYLASLVRLPGYYKMVDDAVARLNDAARKQDARLPTKAGVHQKDADTTWPQLLAHALSVRLELPRERANKIGVLRQRLYVCHEVEGVVPEEHVRAVRRLYEDDPDVQEYTALCLAREDAVAPIEFDAMRWLCGWQRGQDVSSTSQVHAYLANLERRCRAHGAVERFMTVLRECGLESVERIFIS
jgi:hypothetical protein